MDLVTITDHDSIDGCLELLNRFGDMPDFLVGEEVTARLPSFQHDIHIGVYGHNEEQHREIRRLRGNAEELTEYLRQKNLLYVLNHFFHDFWNASKLHEFIDRMAELFSVFEVRNGTLQREHNTLITALLERFRSLGHPVSAVAGSDSHTLRRIGRSYTASPARNREEFVADIRAGRSRVFGPHSNHLSLAADIYGVVLRYYPAVLSIHNGEFSPPSRVEKFFLSVACAPFLFAPYIAAVKHTRTERRRMKLFSSLVSRPQPTWDAAPEVR